MKVVLSPTAIGWAAICISIVCAGRLSAAVRVAIVESNPQITSKTASLLETRLSASAKITLVEARAGGDRFVARTIAGPSGGRRRRAPHGAGQAVASRFAGALRFRTAVRGACTVAIVETHQGLQVCAAIDFAQGSARRRRGGRTIAQRGAEKAVAADPHDLCSAAAGVRRFGLRFFSRISRIPTPASSKACSTSTQVPPWSISTSREQLPRRLLRRRERPWHGHCLFIFSVRIATTEQRPLGACGSNCDWSVASRRWRRSRRAILRPKRSTPFSRESAASFLAKAIAAPTVPSTPRVEAAELAVRAHLMLRRGSWEDAMDLAEASLLLDSHQPEVHRDVLAAIAQSHAPGVAAPTLPPGRRQTEQSRAAPSAAVWSISNRFCAKRK